MNREYRNKIVTEEQFREIEESPEVASVENNGNSGLHNGCTWWTVTTTDGEEFDIYTEAETE